MASVERKPITRRCKGDRSSHEAKRFVALARSKQEKVSKLLKYSFEWKTCEQRDIAIHWLSRPLHMAVKCDAVSYYVKMMITEPL